MTDQERAAAIEASIQHWRAILEAQERKKARNAAAKIGDWIVTGYATFDAHEIARITPTRFYYDAGGYERHVDQMKVLFIADGQTANRLARELNEAGAERAAAEKEMALKHRERVQAIYAAARRQFREEEPS